MIGNCQRLGFREALRAYLPHVEVEVFDLTQLGPAPGSIAAAEAIVAQLSSFSHIFCHAIYGDRFGPLDSRRLVALGLPVHLIPIIAFRSFHPDCVNLSAGGTALHGPLGVYHSAIAAAAFVLGLPADRTVRLYNGMVLRKLGLLGGFAREQARVAQDFATCGLDLADRPQLWMGGSPGEVFMHTINHPKLRPIADTCRMVVERAGLGSFRLEQADGGQDHLARQQSFGVYPAVARTLEIATTGFRDIQPAGMQVPTMRLATFIERSFETYRDAPDTVAAAVQQDPVARRILQTLPSLLAVAA